LDLSLAALDTRPRREACEGYLDSRESMQQAYYARTAAAYDHQHLGEAGGHEAALAVVASLLGPPDRRRLLHVGAGPGRSLQVLQGRHASLKAVGGEPSMDLLRVARSKGLDVLRASGTALPFPDGAFDVVVETGVLHHVADPGRVVREMMRVARKAVFI